MAQVVDLARFGQVSEGVPDRFTIIADTDPEADDWAETLVGVMDVAMAERGVSRLRLVVTLEVIDGDKREGG